MFDKQIKMDIGASNDKLIQVLFFTNMVRVT